MAACPHCGATNRDGDRFCMVCGKPLGAPPTQQPRQPAPAAEPAAEAAGLDGLLDAGVVCPNCDTYNDPEAKACVSCGASLHGLTGYLQSVDAAPAPDSAQPASSAAAAASGQTGAAAEEAEEDATPTAPELQASPQPAEPATAPELPASEPAAAAATAEPTPTATAPPAKRTGPLPASPAAAPAAGEPVSICPYCQAPLPAGGRICLACGRSAQPSESPAEPAPDRSVRLRLVRGYGREDSTFPVGPTGVTVGRGQAMVPIPDDPFLAPVHLALAMEDGRLTCRDAGSLNGTFVRVRGQAELKQGAELVSGNQRFVLLGLGGPTTDVRMPVSQDTRAYGGPAPRQLFVALRLNHADPQGRPLAGSVLLRSGPVVSVGQWGCDLNFPTDPALAPRQFELHVRPTGLRLVESPTSTGVFVRIKGPVALQNGDELLAGDEHFRVEIG